MLARLVRVVHTCGQPIHSMNFIPTCILLCLRNCLCLGVFNIYGQLMSYTLNASGHVGFAEGKPTYLDQVTFIKLALTNRSIPDRTGCKNSTKQAESLNCKYEKQHHQVFRSSEKRQVPPQMFTHDGVCSYADISSYYFELLLLSVFLCSLLAGRDAPWTKHAIEIASYSQLLLNLQADLVLL